jgi:hypothetical protein
MKGLIIIPDITGFTNFVKSMDNALGMAITSELLNEIIDNNPLNIELSEIEGDALLFYKLGQPLKLDELFNGLNKMYQAFNTKFDQLKKMHHLEVDLSLKFIVHYGNIDVYDIKGFRKLYGQTVIESHSLLKNGEGESDYILITEDYFDAVQQTNLHNHISDWKYKRNTSQLLNGLRNISYHFYNYFPALSLGRTYSASI